MGVLRTPGEEMRGWGRGFLMTKNRLALGGYPPPLPAGRCPGWRFARDDPPSSPADPPGRLPYPQIIPAPSRKHPCIQRARGWKIWV